MKYYICTKCRKTFATIGNIKDRAHCERRLREVNKEDYSQHKKNMIEYKKIRDGENE